eukprot:1655263-Pleurochrysis_carterae.AAC.1
MPIQKGTPHAAADGDDHDDDDAPAPAAAPPTTPAPLPAGRRAATYELECIRLRPKIDTQRNTINNLEAEIVARCGSQVAIDLAFAAAFPLDLPLPRRHPLFDVSSRHVGVPTQVCARRAQLERL